jgi:hypothetical protein
MAMRVRQQSLRTRNLTEFLGRSVSNNTWFDVIMAQAIISGALSEKAGKESIPIRG